MSDNWGVGVNARYMYAHGERYVDTVSGDPLTDTAHTFGMMFSALYD